MATKSAAKKAAPKSGANRSAAPKKSSGQASSKENSSDGEKVKPTSEAATGLRELFEDSLKDIYWAEKALTKALPKMGKNATSPELADAIAEHLEVTKAQVLRLEEVFQVIGKKAQAKKCDAMEGLIKEGEGIMEETVEGVVRDAGIIAASQKIEHYEIATYGTLVSFATILGEDEAAALLGQTLQEEKDADSILTEVAETAVNVAAADDEDEDEEDEKG